MKQLSNKISLGTAKLGLDDYGFSSNELPKDKIKFLEKSYDMGVQSFDTSPRYGNSEIIIGDFLDNIRDTYFTKLKARQT